jgi:hypothetical protein
MIHIKNYSLGTKQLSLIYSIEEDSLVETIIVDLKSGLIRGMASEGSGPIRGVFFYYCKRVAL